MTQHAPVVGLVFMVSMAGCGMTSSYSATARHHPEPRCAADIDMLFEGDTPVRSVKRVGLLEVRSSSSIPDSKGAVQLMRRKAAELGVDGVADIRCGSLHTVGVGQCTGAAFVYLAPTPEATSSRADERGKR